MYTRKNFSLKTAAKQCKIIQEHKLFTTQPSPFQLLIFIVLSIISLFYGNLVIIKLKCYFFTHFQSQILNYPDILIMCIFIPWMSERYNRICKSYSDLWALYFLGTNIVVLMYSQYVRNTKVSIVFFCLFRYQ